VLTSARAELPTGEFDTVDDRRQEVVGSARLDVTGRRLWPHRAFRIDSPLPPSDVLDRIELATFPFRWWRRSPVTRPFDGTVTPTVTPSTFSLQSTTARWRTWRWARPRLQGRIVASGTGSRITGTYTLQTAVAVVLSLFCIWVTAFAGLLVVSAGFDIAASITTGNSPLSLDDVLLTAAGVAVALLLVGLVWIRVVRPFGDHAHEVVRALAVAVGERPIE
jgi:hypothetical protein